MTKANFQLQYLLLDMNRFCQSVKCVNKIDYRKGKLWRKWIWGWGIFNVFAWRIFRNNNSFTILRRCTSASVWMFPFLINVSLAVVAFIIAVVFTRTAFTKFFWFLVYTATYQIYVVTNRNRKSILIVILKMSKIEVSL